MNETLPTDRYSREQARLLGNPAAVTLTRGSTVDTTDYYGNAETWVVNTIRVEGADTAFVQRVSAEGGERHVLPPKVMAALWAQREALTGKTRRRGARRAVETKREAGQQVGNPEALRRARGARRKVAR